MRDQTTHEGSLNRRYVREPSQPVTLGKRLSKKLAAGSDKANSQ
jgi:hypothetical protein